MTKKQIGDWAFAILMVALLIFVSGPMFIGLFFAIIDGWKDVIADGRMAFQE